MASLNCCGSAKKKNTNDGFVRDRYNLRSAVVQESGRTRLHYQSISDREGTHPSQRSKNDSKTANTMRKNTRQPPPLVVFPGRAMKTSGISQVPKHTEKRSHAPLYNTERKQISRGEILREENSASKPGMRAIQPLPEHYLDKTSLALYYNELKRTGRNLESEFEDGLIPSLKRQGNMQNYTGKLKKSSSYNEDIHNARYNYYGSIENESNYLKIADSDTIRNDQDQNCSNSYKAEKTYLSKTYDQIMGYDGNLEYYHSNLQTNRDENVTSVSSIKIIGSSSKDHFCDFAKERNLYERDIIFKQLENNGVKSEDVNVGIETTPDSNIFNQPSSINSYFGKQSVDSVRKADIESAIDESSISCEARVIDSSIYNQDDCRINSRQIPLPNFKLETSLISYVNEVAKHSLDETHNSVKEKELDDRVNESLDTFTEIRHEEEFPSEIQSSENQNEELDVENNKILVYEIENTDKQLDVRNVVSKYNEISQEGNTQVEKTNGFIKELDSLREQVKHFEEELTLFEGTPADPKYYYIEENLTRILLKLDKLNIEYSTDLRAKRRSIIKYIYGLLEDLEEKTLNPKYSIMDTDAV